MSLFTPAWKSENKTTALNAVEKCNNDKKLTKIALESPHTSVCVAAVEKITDQKKLIKVFNETEMYYVRDACVDKIDDQRVLLDLAFQAPNYNAMVSALSKIDDLGLLKEYLKQFDLKNDTNARGVLVVFAYNRSQNDIRRYILDDIADQEMLAEIAKKSNKYSDVHSIAIGKITDKELLLQLAEKVHSNALRDRLLELGMIDKEMLRWVHYLDHPQNMKRLIKDEEKLYDKLMEKENGDIIWSAYIRENVDELSAYPCEETIEALSLIMVRHERDPSGKNRKLQTQVYSLLKEYYSDHPDLKNAIRIYANGKKIPHEDYTRPGCQGSGHDDYPRVVFEFTK